jgi:hypothetical protein
LKKLNIELPLKVIGPRFMRNKKNKTKKIKEIKMSGKNIIGIVVAIAMLGVMAASAAPLPPTPIPHVNGSGKIVSVSWSPSPIQAIPIPFGTGATIKLEAQGLLQIFYNGKPIVVGINQIPKTNPPIEANFNGMLITPTPLCIPYNGVATLLPLPTATSPNLWKLVLSFNTPPYSSSVTLEIVGPLKIT